MNYRFSLIGYPINHSLSPWIHGQFLMKADLQGNYTINEIEPSKYVENKIKTVMESGIHGFNVTVPYKQKIIPFLDEVDPLADKMGAVNTVANKNGTWIGYNTDGIGYVRSLESKYPELLLDKSQHVLLIGAGGAARGIYSALDHTGFTRIDITNRTKESANEIARLGSPQTTTKTLSLQEAENKLGDYGVIIQTTSVGMKPGVGQSIIKMDNLKSTSIVSDIIYQPLKTKFLMDAKASGASIHLGHTMLLYQAQYAFEIWTGKQVPIDNMDNELQLILEGR